MIGPMSQIAFIGTGLLGAGMVENLLRRGHAVRCWNRTASKAHALEPLGASVSPTLEHVVADAERVHLALPDDAVVDEVLRVIRPHLRADAIVFDHTTTAPAGTRDRIAACAAWGVRFLHAPVFMSPQMCREAKGMMLVSGPASLIDPVMPALAEMTGDVWHVGDRPDLAACYKLFGNSMMFTIVAGLADVFAMGANQGITPAEAFRLFTRFQPGNVIGYRGLQMSKADFTASFEMTMARKDVRLMLEAAGGEALVALPALAARMDESITAGHGQDDLGAIAAEVILRAQRDA